MTFDVIRRDNSTSGQPHDMEDSYTGIERDDVEDAVTKLQKAVSSETFYETAERILETVDDPSDLAKCAELAGRREPGGAYYRAKMWARAETLRTAVEHSHASDWGRGTKTLGLLCVEVKVSISTAKAYIAQGLAIEKAEQENATAQHVGGAYVDIKSLREAPATILQYAQSKKDKATEYLLEAASILEENPRATAAHIHNKWCQQNGSIKANLDIIKPSDWWAFSHPKYRQNEDFPGSIPGEIYANALYYFAPTTGIAVDPMAGSGMLKRVYDDRLRWQKDSNFSLEVHLFDLYPRRDFISSHDARHPLPFKADWIFLDPPYFGQSSHLYDGDLASTTDYFTYMSILGEIIRAMALSLNKGGRLCILLPKWSGLKQIDPNHDIPTDARSLATSAGLTWIDTAYISRGRQQEAASAVKNNAAKRQRRMRSDTCVLNVFELEDSHV